MFIQSFLCTRHSAQYGIYILSFNLYFSTINRVPLSPLILYRLGRFPKFSQLVKYRSGFEPRDLTSSCEPLHNNTFITRSKINPRRVPLNLQFSQSTEIVQFAQWPALLETSASMLGNKGEIQRRGRMNPVLTMSSHPPSAVVREEQRRNDGELWASVQKSPLIHRFVLQGFSYLWPTIVQKY